MKRERTLLSPARFFSALICAGLILSAAAASQEELAAGRKRGPSGLPIPRFVSLKADEVNMRRGPGGDHAVTWVFRRAGLPVEIIAEFDNWRQVRDSEGATGWVLGPLLSGRRTALVAPWSKEKQIFALYASPAASSAVKARLEPGLLVNLLSCDGRWCKLTAPPHSGWMSQDSLWGVYPEEKIQ